MEREIEILSEIRSMLDKRMKQLENEFRSKAPELLPYARTLFFFCPSKKALYYNLPQDIFIKLGQSITDILDAARRETEEKAKGCRHVLYKRRKLMEMLPLTYQNTWFDFTPSALSTMSGFSFAYKDSMNEYSCKSPFWGFISPFRGNAFADRIMEDPTFLPLVRIAAFSCGENSGFCLISPLSKEKRVIPLFDGKINTSDADFKVLPPDGVPSRTYLLIKSSSKDRFRKDDRCSLDPWDSYPYVLVDILHAGIYEDILLNHDHTMQVLSREKLSEIYDSLFPTTLALGWSQKEAKDYILSDMLNTGRPFIKKEQFSCLFPDESTAPEHADAGFGYLFVPTIQYYIYDIFPSIHKKGEEVFQQMEQNFF